MSALEVILIQRTVSRGVSGRTTTAPTKSRTVFRSVAGTVAVSTNIWTVWRGMSICTTVSTKIRTLGRGVSVRPTVSAGSRMVCLSVTVGLTEMTGRWTLFPPMIARPTVVTFVTAAVFVRSHFEKL